MTDVGETPYGRRRIATVTGGTFEGEEIQGTVLPSPGGDWLLLRRDGILMLNVRLTLKTDDGHLIYMRYEGMRHGPPWVIEQLNKGEKVDPNQYYFRTTPWFETASEKYRFLNRIVCVATGRRDPTGPVYEVFHIFEAHPVSTTSSLPARPGRASSARARCLRITDLEGQQAVDFLCYNAADPQERYHAPNTLKAAGTIFLTTGHKLYSDIARPIFTIVEDQFGGHDTIGGCCSAPSNEMLYGVKDCPGCRENFLAALSRHGLGRKDIVPNINWFMRVPVTAEGGAAIASGVSPPGCQVALRAEMDALAVISNCPQVNNPCNGFKPTPIRVEITG